MLKGAQPAQQPLPAHDQGEQGGGCRRVRSVHRLRTYVKTWEYVCMQWAHDVHMCMCVPFHVDGLCAPLTIRAGKVLGTDVCVGCTAVVNVQCGIAVCVCTLLTRHNVPACM